MLVTASKTIKSKYGQFDVSRDRDSSFVPQEYFLTSFTATTTDKKERSTFRGEWRFNYLTLYQRYECKKYSTSPRWLIWIWTLYSNITDKVIEKVNEWQSHPLDKIYPIIFMDATVLKIRVSSKEYSCIYNAYTRR